jgi:adenosylcobinamide-GDP ribazoletransferase
LLTVLPIPAKAKLEGSLYRMHIERAGAFFPLVGTLIGCVTAALCWLASCMWPQVIAVLLSLVIEAWLTGAFHEDAVADFCDAFGGGWTRDDVLRILKDSRIGSYGALGLGLLVALRVVCFVEIAPALLVPTIVASTTLGRWLILLVMTSIDPVAKRDSIARHLGPRLSWRQFASGTVAALPGCLWLATAKPSVFAFSVSALVVFAATFVPYLAHRLGGSTGDCLGFAGYVGQLVVLLSAAISFT